MPFNIIYYVTLASPTIESSKEMISKYAANGARAIQLDMPSSYPNYETPFIQNHMKKALEICSNYEFYMNAIRDIRNANPSLQLHLVAYPDVIEGIGRDSIISFYKEVRLASFMPVSRDIKYKESFRKDGLAVIDSIGNELDSSEIAYILNRQSFEIVTVNYRQHKKNEQSDNRTLKDKVKLLRSSGIKSKLYAVEGIATKEMMFEVKDAGMDGALVGNVLMKLWDNEEELWDLFHRFHSLED
jgi:tryptophan synthase alpha chain